jgi:hypothetical protein
LRGCVQAALRRHLGATLGNQATVSRTHFAGDPHHLVGRCHLEVEPGLQGFARDPNIPVLDVPAILAQMHRDVVSARLLGDQRGEHGVRIGRTAHLAQRGHVVDVDSEMQHGEGL